MSWPAEPVRLDLSHVPAPPPLSAEEQAEVERRLLRAPEQPSLDTRQHLDNRARIRRQTARIEGHRRRQDGKPRLAAAIDDAALGRFGAGALDEATLLAAMATHLRGCLFARAWREAGCGAYVARPSSCRVRLCPDCERARSARLVARFAELADGMAHPTLWTFTTRNAPAGGLAPAIDVILEALRRLRRRGFRSSGGVYSVEVTRNPDPRIAWNVHVHALADAPYQHQPKIRRAWLAATCDATRYLEAKRASPGRRVKLRRCAHQGERCRGSFVVDVHYVRGAASSELRRKAVREVLKYVAKGIVDEHGALVAGCGPADLAELLLAIRNRRLVAGWGSLRNVHDVEEEELDPADYWVGPDAPAELRGLPRRCPFCLQEAFWDYPVEVDRRACTPADDGVLRWRPPPGQLRA